MRPCEVFFCYFGCIVAILVLLKCPSSLRIQFLGHRLNYCQRILFIWQMSFALFKCFQKCIPVLLFLAEKILGCRNGDDCTASQCLWLLCCFYCFQVVMQIFLSDCCVLAYLPYHQSERELWSSGHIIRLVVVQWTFHLHNTGPVQVGEMVKVFAEALLLFPLECCLIILSLRTLGSYFTFSMITIPIAMSFIMTSGAICTRFFLQNLIRFYMTLTYIKFIFNTVYLCLCIWIHIVHI